MASPVVFFRCGTRARLSARFPALLFALTLFAAAAPGPAAAAAPPNRTPVPAGVVVPNFWNVERRLERPDAATLPKELRFLTSDDYPPFNFAGADGMMAGFNVDLARAICTELALPCTVQAVPFEALTERLEQGRGEAIIAGLAATPANRASLDFTERYLGTPARFVGRKAPGGPAPAADPRLAATPEQVADKRIAVVGRTAHEAYLRSFFNEAAIRTYPDLRAAQEALRKGEVDLVFGDGIALALWLNGVDSAGCCGFVGGPFTESRFFGDGFAVAVKSGNGELRHAIDYALQRIWEKGIYTDIYLRWFPIGIY